MPKAIFLVHWNKAEAGVLAEGLRQSGWTVEVEAKDGARAYRRMREAPPRAVVVYLTRLPSHGVRTAQALLTTARTRAVPVLFVGGSGEALAKAKAKVPGAIFVAADGVASGLQRLISTPA